MGATQLTLVIILCAALLLAAAIDFWKLKVPNRLTYPLVFSGWILSLLLPTRDGFALFWFSEGWFLDVLARLGASFALTLIGLALLLPLYAIGGMGAGDVKMQAGFGSWVGAIFGWGAGIWIVIWGFCIAVLVGGVIAAFMMFFFGSGVRRHAQNMKEIVGDWFTSSSVQEVADRAGQRKPRLRLLPYGVPLCIGFIAILVLPLLLRPA